MTEEQKQQMREQLYRKPVADLIDMIIDAQEEVEDAKQLKRKILQIRNIILDQEERRAPGRPRRGESDMLLFKRVNAPRPVTDKG